jgi:predicted helicase
LIAATKAIARTKSAAKTRALSSEADKGTTFERLTQLYLQTAPEYRAELQHVWLLREVPAVPAFLFIPNRHHPCAWPQSR